MIVFQTTFCIYIISFLLYTFSDDVDFQKRSKPVVTHLGAGLLITILALAV